MVRYSVYISFRGRIGLILSSVLALQNFVDLWRFGNQNFFKWCRSQIITREFINSARVTEIGSRVLVFTSLFFSLNLELITVKVFKPKIIEVTYFLSILSNCTGTSTKQVWTHDHFAVLRQRYKQAAKGNFWFKRTNDDLKVILISNVSISLSLCGIQATGARYWIMIMFWK